MTGRTRPPAVAGQFYPADPDVLARTVDDLIAGATAGTLPAEPKALILPHAGYQYSGPVAASGYSLLATRKGIVSLVILLGPAHFHPLNGLAVPTVDAFDTPLGPVTIANDARTVALSRALAVPDDAPHREEHSLEVHIPFLQRTLPDADVLPVVVGRADRGPVADLLDALWGGPETAVVVSSDLSHYHDYETARRLDRVTADAIAAGDAVSLSPDRACGFYPVAGLLEAGRRHSLTGRLLDLRNSGDTAGPRDAVVGYGAFAFFPVS